MHDHWFANAPVGDGRLNLVCLPFAGGSSAAFAGWRRKLPAWLNVCPVVLPGREGRRHELRARDFASLAGNLADTVITAVDGRNYCLYGHSMGAWLAHSIAVAGSAAGVPPACVCVGAQHAPHLVYPFPSCDRMSDDNLLEFMQEFDGVDAQMLAHAEWVRWMLLRVRDDLKLCETHSHEAPYPVLDLPVHAFVGRSDRLIDPSCIAAWQRHTTYRLDMTLFDGGHFFIRTAEAPFLHELADKLARYAGSTSLSTQQTDLRPAQATHRATT